MTQYTLLESGMIGMILLSVFYEFSNKDTIKRTRTALYALGMLHIETGAFHKTAKSKQLVSPILSN